MPAKYLAAIKPGFGNYNSEINAIPDIYAKYPTETDLKKDFPIRAAISNNLFVSEINKWKSGCRNTSDLSARGFLGYSETE